MKHIYLFSGIGAGHRVFQYLDFLGYKTTFIQWIPIQREESIETYAQQLLKQITSNKPILIGLSFGGIMAAEVAKIIETEKIILIASVKTYCEIPPYFQNSSSLQFHQLLPTWLLTRPNFIINWFFGTQSKSDRKLLAEILNDTDPLFLKWAMGKIANWKNVIIHKNLIHIHGTAGRLFPIRYVKCDIPVKDGGHFMTVNNAKELNAINRQSLNN
ncbi:MAG TPA: alpha/beta hydrolase [Chitinophagaceae bacterium]